MLVRLHALIGKQCYLNIRHRPSSPGLFHIINVRADGIFIIKPVGDNRLEVEEKISRLLRMRAPRKTASAAAKAKTARFRPVAHLSPKEYAMTALLHSHIGKICYITTTTAELECTIQGVNPCGIYSYVEGDRVFFRHVQDIDHVAFRYS
jgi:hypothetical protein